MTRRLTLSILGALALSLSIEASALEFKSLNDNAVVFDAGSSKASPQFILLKGTPVEQIVSVDKWVKVREPSGGMGWIERHLVSDATQVIVREARADVRTQANESAPLVFQADKDVLLEVIDKTGTNAWIQVKHKDGQTGFVLRKSIWGI